MASKNKKHGKSAAIDIGIGDKERKTIADRLAHRLADSCTPHLKAHNC